MCYIESQSMEPVIKDRLSLAEYRQLEEDTNTRYRGSETENWQMAWHEGKDSMVHLQSLNIDLPLNKIYSQIEDL